VVNRNIKLTFILGQLRSLLNLVFVRKSNIGLYVGAKINGIEKIKIRINSFEGISSHLILETRQKKVKFIRLYTDTTLGRFRLQTVSDFNLTVNLL